jgi:hypothetical protein
VLYAVEVFPVQDVLEIDTSALRLLDVLSENLPGVDDSEW